MGEAPLPSVQACRDLHRFGFAIHFARRDRLAVGKFLGSIDADILFKRRLQGTLGNVGSEVP